MNFTEKALKMHIEYTSLRTTVSLFRNAVFAKNLWKYQKKFQAANLPCNTNCISLEKQSWVWTFSYLKGSILGMIIIFFLFPFICFGFCFKFKSERLTIPGRWQWAALAWDGTGNTILSPAPAARVLLDKCNSSSGGRTERYDERTKLKSQHLLLPCRLTSICQKLVVIFTSLQEAGLQNVGTSTYSTKPY